MLNRIPIPLKRAAEAILISARTKLLFALTLLLLVPAIRIAHTRLTLCETRPHPNARHAPIPGSSGDPADFGCKLFAPATLTEKAIDLAAILTALGFLRSLLIDRQTRRQQRLNDL
jgi:hypothetical protein